MLLRRARARDRAGLVLSFPLGAVLFIAGLTMLAAGALLLVAARSGQSLISTFLGAYVVAWSSLVVGIALLSSVSQVSRWTVLALCAVVFVAGVARWRRGPRRGSELVARLTEAGRDAFRPVAVRTLAAVTGAALAYIVILALFTAPNDWDGLTYHLPRAALWLQQHAVGYVPEGNEPRLNSNPPVGEIGMLFSLALGGGDRFAASPQLIALVAAAVAVAGLGRRIGLDRQQAAFAAMTFAGLPIVLLQGQSIMVDLVVASFLLAAAYFLLDGRAEGPFGALAIALALGSKFTAILFSPILALVVLTGVPPGRRRYVARWALVGIVLGLPWYLLNLVETGSPDGDITASSDQAAERTFASIVTTVRALAVDVIDLSGARGTHALLFVVIGLAIVVGAVVVGLRRGDRPLLFSCALAGIAVAVTPTLLRATADPLMRVYEKGWIVLGRSDIAFAKPNNWEVSSWADTSKSWFGPVGTLALVSVVAIAPAAARRRRLPPVAIALAAAPLIAFVIVAVTIVWDPWRARLLMFPVGLAVAVWGIALESRWRTWVTVGLAATTMTLSLGEIYTKPSGIRIGEEPQYSIWGRDRIGVQSTLRGTDGTEQLLRAVEKSVPADATLAVSAHEDWFLSPFFGPHYDRRVVLVGNGEPVDPSARWLVVVRAHPRLCAAEWQLRAADAKHEWSLLERRPAPRCPPKVDS